MTQRTQRPWTNAETEALKVLIAEGNSARAIGVKLGRSKNSVITKSHALGLQCKGRAGGYNPPGSKKPFVGGVPRSLPKPSLADPWGPWAMAR